MVERCMDRASKNYSGVKLNYVTLRISEKTITKEFQNHKTMVQTRPMFFWACQIIVFFNLVTNGYNLFKNPD